MHFVLNPMVFVPKSMDPALNPMVFAPKRMVFAPKSMRFALNPMDFALKEGRQTLKMSYVDATLAGV